MATDPQTGLPRRRGRPRKVPLAPQTQGYPGVSLDNILGMTDQQVQIAFDEIGEEPSPFHWSEDEQLNRAAWSGFGQCDSSPSESVVPIAELHESSRAIHNGILKMELLSTHLRRWIDSLEDGALVAEVEWLTGEKLGESAKRYSKRSELQQQVSELTWPTLIAASKLYVPTINPLDGSK
jgi:hypothetical protein